MEADDESVHSEGGGLPTPAPGPAAGAGAPGSDTWAAAAAAGGGDGAPAVPAQPVDGAGDAAPPPPLAAVDGAGDAAPPPPAAGLGPSGLAPPAGGGPAPAAPGGHTWGDGLRSGMWVPPGEAAQPPPEAEQQSDFFPFPTREEIRRRRSESPLWLARVAQIGRSVTDEELEDNLDRALGRGRYQVELGVVDRLPPPERDHQRTVARRIWDGAASGVKRVREFINPPEKRPRVGDPAPNPAAAAAAAAAVRRDAPQDFASPAALTLVPAREVGVLSGGAIRDGVVREVDRVNHTVTVKFHDGDLGTYPQSVVFPRVQPR
eukprot:TRINITY_DN60393_c0_g1_i1.p1 TRINITY_DN60393_c0_g1~~TRINITY_DN60393_c0_g1_i1.p1  ORF type:complete len:319 (+),score=72.92 TRINITY_DN60393_c0_g1_i1:108-1064(+)